MLPRVATYVVISGELDLDLYLGSTSYNHDSFQIPIVDPSTASLPAFSENNSLPSRVSTSVARDPLGDYSLGR
jgi:hypothetical protein